MLTDLTIIMGFWKYGFNTPNPAKQMNGFIERVGQSPNSREHQAVYSINSIGDRRRDAERLSRGNARKHANSASFGKIPDPILRGTFRTSLNRAASALACLLCVVLAIGSPVAQADATVPVGDIPIALVANPVTGKVYVANRDSGTVTVIDGANNSTATVSVGTTPIALAVNPATNKIYVTNQESNSVTVIDGANNSTATVSVGTSPIALAVNPLTNMIYVANQLGNSVTAINGANNSTATITTGVLPVAVAVNPVTNRIYVANTGSHSVTVINGDNNSTTSVATILPVALAVNPVTNRIYVASQAANTVTVINGSDNSTQLVATLDEPIELVANPVTNKIYVVNRASNAVTVINGANNAVTFVPTGARPVAVAVNPVTNMIYVTNQLGNSVTSIDGMDNSVTTEGVGQQPVAVAVNPLTNRIYIANALDGSVTTIDGAQYLSDTTLGGRPGPGCSGGNRPTSVAVNPLTNKVYIPSFIGNVRVLDGTNNTSVTLDVENSNAVALNPFTNTIYLSDGSLNAVHVIDGNDNSVLQWRPGVGQHPCAIAVNPVTDRVYVVSDNGDSVTTFSGRGPFRQTVAVGNQPTDVAVNPVTNLVYVPIGLEDRVVVMDGTDIQSMVRVNVGDLPSAVAVNPVTNKIYVANFDGDSVTVINGADNSTTTVTVGDAPVDLAVNTVTNLIYVANRYSNSVTVIDGTDNSTTNLPVLVPGGTGPGAIALNMTTNKIYVSVRDLQHESNNNVMVIDGMDHSATTLYKGSVYGQDLAVNPVTNRTYVANTNTIRVIDEQRDEPIPLVTTISPLADDRALTLTPTFQVEASWWSILAVQQIYYQIDTWTGQWLRATPAGAKASVTTSPLTPGIHILHAFAVNGQEASSTSGSSPVTGEIASYMFLVAPNPKLEVTPASLDFGQQLTDAGPTNTMKMTITNVGEGQATITNVRRTGINWNAFVIASDSGEKSLLPGEKREFELTFDPVSVGPKSARLEITSDDVDAPLMFVDLSGNAVGDEIFIDSFESP